MKKILITSYNLGLGGIEKSLITLLKNFDYSKYEVTLVLERKEGMFINEVPSSVKILEYKVSESSNVFIRKTLNLIKRLKWLIRNYKKYDASICYAPYSLPCSIITQYSSNNKIIFVHSNYKYVYEDNNDMVYEFFNRRNINNYDSIIFVSNESKSDFVSFYPKLKSKCHVINNLVDYDYINKAKDEKVEIEKTNKKVFLFVGRLDEHSKRLSLLLSIAKKCKEEKVNAVFWIVGSGPDYDMYKKYTVDNNLDNVAFLGAKKNPYPYIKACDYVVLTSRYEGFPVIYNEAIIIKKPIITTIDVTDDYISIKDRFGYIADSKNIFDKIKELSTKSEKIKETVDYETLNKKRIKLIEEILEEKKDD